jgi:hypothetical protein
MTSPSLGPRIRPLAIVLSRKIAQIEARLRMRRWKRRVRLRAGLIRRLLTLPRSPA